MGIRQSWSGGAQSRLAFERAGKDEFLPSGDQRGCRTYIPGLSLVTVESQ